MKQKTDEMLCSTFLEMLKKIPFHKITIQKIADQCNVNRQTFYYHFDNIYDLTTKALEYELVRSCDVEATDKWGDILTNLMCWLKENQAIVKNILHNMDVFYLRKSIYRIIETCLVEKLIGKRQLTVSEDIPAENVNNFLIIGMTQYLVDWVNDDCKEPISDIVSMYLLVMDRIYN